MKNGLNLSLPTLRRFVSGGFVFLAFRVCHKSALKALKLFKQKERGSFKVSEN